MSQNCIRMPVLISASSVMMQIKIQSYSASTRRGETWHPTKYFTQILVLLSRDSIEMLPQQQDGIISAFPALMTMAEAGILVRRL